MKRFTAIVLVMLAGLFTAGRLQAQNHEVRANIPFNFIVNGKQLPPGSYRFSSDSYATVIIQNRNQPIAVLSKVVAADGAPLDVSRLVFHRYGDQYFLSEIRCALVGMNVEIPRSKLEKQARTQQASLEPDRVLVAAE
jgi:hypothetical protein